MATRHIAQENATGSLSPSPSDSQSVMYSRYLFEASILRALIDNPKCCDELVSHLPFAEERDSRSIYL